jgi:uncharacterized protein (TIGR02145 family)
MKNIYTYLLLAGVALCCTQCESDSAGNPVFGKDEIPRIYLDWRADITVKVGVTLEIKPIVSPSDHATYRWTINDKVISTERDLVYEVTEADAGDSELRFTVERYGKQNFRTARLYTPPPPIVDPNAKTIGGVTWASCNVAAPGVFAESPDKYGLLYQWGIDLGWPPFPASNVIAEVEAHDGTPGTAWKTSIVGNVADEWNKGNGPCPDGWRLPTQAELKALLDYPNKKWTANYGETTGTGSTPDSRGYIFTVGGSEFFLVAPGRRNPDGAKTGDKNNGYYWSSEPADAASVKYVYFSNGSSTAGSSDRARACSVRCVQKPEQ